MGIETAPLDFGTSVDLNSPQILTNKDLSSMLNSSLAFHGTQLQMNATQSLTAGVATTILFGAEDFDTDAYHSTVSNTSRITIPTGKAGYYRINAHLELIGVPNANVTMFLYLNGLVKTDLVQISAGTPFLQGSFIISLAVGDYLELVVNSVGAGQGIVGTATDYLPSYFSATLIGI